MVADYEERQERRRQRLEAKADRLALESDQALGRAHAIMDMIPLGQPILVGHHSEGRARRDQRRIHDGIRKGVDLSKQAARASAAADAVGTAGISSDDPTAIDQLRAKLARCETDQAEWKRINGLVRAARKAHSDDRAKVADYLIANGVSAAITSNAAKPDFCGRWGIPNYALENNSAEIRRIKKRIAALDAAATVETTSEAVGVVRLVRNAEENRLQLIFPGKPAAAIIAELKSAGFRWSPMQGAWQRHLSNAAEYYGRRIAAKASNDDAAD